MQRSARTAQTIRPSLSGSSTMQPATGQAAWQIEHANAPKQRSGSITAIVLGAFLRGPLIILVHMGPELYLNQRKRWPTVGSPTSGMTAHIDEVFSQRKPFEFVAKKRAFPGSAASAAALKLWAASPTATPLQVWGEFGYAVPSRRMM